MNRLWWYLRLWFWCGHYGYFSWLRPLEGWRFCYGQPECWDEQRIEGLSPKETVLEDPSYA